MTVLIMVALGDLHVSRENVRPYDPDTDPNLAMLAASARSIGIIQPIVIRKRAKGGGFEVLAGRRRWEAAKLAELAELPALQVDKSADAKQISLAENYARSAMTLPDIYTAFAAIRAERPNASVEDLGAMFGYDPVRTRRILRLANLSHEVMEKYRGGEIDDATAMAFAATEDKDLQDQVLKQFRELPNWQQTGQGVRKLLGMIEGDEKRQFDFVGREAYAAAGGRFEEDLFNEGSGRLLDSSILLTIYGERFEEEKDRFIHRIQRNGKKIVADGAGMGDLLFSWADSPPQVTQYGYTSSDHELHIQHPKLAPLSKEDKKLAEELDADIEALNNALDVEDPDDDDPRFGQLVKLEAARADIDSGRFITLPKKGAIVGIAKVENGQFQVDLWYASRKEKGFADPLGGRTKGATAAEASPGEKLRRRLGITKDSAHAMFLVRRDMVRDNLYQSTVRGSSIALDFLVYSQARSILRQSGVDWEGKPVISGGQQGIETPACQDSGSSKPPKKVREVFAKLTAGMAYRAGRLALAQQDWVTVHDPIVGFPLFRSASQDTKNEAAAIVACHGLIASESFYNDGATPRMVEELASYLTPDEGGSEWRDTIMLDTAFFELFNHKRRMEMLASWGAGDHPDGKKSATSAAYCAKVVNADEEGQAALGIAREDGRKMEVWLPEILEMMAVAPLAEEKGDKPAEPDGDDAGTEHLEPVEEAELEDA